MKEMEEENYGSCRIKNTGVSRKPFPMWIRRRSSGCAPRRCNYAKQLLKKAANDPEVSGMLGEFLWELPHKYYEENNLHGMLLEGMPNFDACAWGTGRISALRG